MSDIASILMLNGGGSLPRKGDNPVLEALIDGALKKSQEPGFFSREAGQNRRAWLDETVTYFTPPELRGPLGLLNEANPVTSMERASTASQTMLAPETSGWGRVAAGGDMLSNMAGVVAPAMVAGKAGMPAVNAIEEGLLGWAPGMPAAAGNFLADEFGGMKLYHGSPNDFDKFSMDYAGTTTDSGQLGRAIYGSTDPNVADRYPKKYEIDADIKNPLKLAMPDWRTGKQKVITDALGLPSDTPSKEIAEEAMRRGYDSAVLDYSPAGYPQQEVAVFDDKLISIVKKYGLAGAATMLGVSQADVAEAMEGQQ